jgi:predicted MFS family arabinose efflux permease
MQIPNFKILLQLSGAFFVMLFSFYGAVTVYSKLLKENGHETLAFQGLSLMYLAFGLGSIIAPSIANKFKTQNVMRTAGLAYTIWILSGYMATSKGISPSLVSISVILCSFT